MKNSTHPICIFDRLEALAVYAADYHSGQSSFLYSVLGRLDLAGFRPRPSLDGRYENLSWDGQSYYHSLEERRVGQ